MSFLSPRIFLSNFKITGKVKNALDVCRSIGHVLLAIYVIELSHFLGDVVIIRPAVFTSPTLSGTQLGWVHLGADVKVLISSLAKRAYNSHAGGQTCYSPLLARPQGPDDWDNFL